MNNDFVIAVTQLAQKAPKSWISSMCETLQSVPADAGVDCLIQKLPATNNADLSAVATDVLRRVAGQLSWEAASWAIHTAFVLNEKRRNEQSIELLWSGPSPATEIAARRIDQALYDLISTAERQIVLITFAAARIHRLTTCLLEASSRGVDIRLVLEFEETSEGQLSFDALKAFPPALVKTANVYYWPVEKRERNNAGRPGKLHAKAAIIDDIALVSSANLTDDAFNRNLELGVAFRNSEVVSRLEHYIDHLVMSGNLVRWT